jgi:hypothetical protein
MHVGEDTLGGVDAKKNSECTIVMLLARKGERKGRPPLGKSRQPVDWHLDVADLFHTVHATDLPLDLSGST